MAYVDIETRVEFDITDCDPSDSEIEDFIRHHFNDLDIDTAVSIVTENFDSDYFIPLLWEDLSTDAAVKILYKILDSREELRNTILENYQSKPRGFDILAKYLDIINPNWKSDNYPFNNVTFIASILNRLVMSTPKNTIKPAEDRSLEYE
jgi:hypothetical protein